MILIIMALYQTMMKTMKKMMTTLPQKKNQRIVVRLDFKK